MISEVQASLQSRGTRLGSSSLVLDKATSELVEATRYQAYGATESDYRPERWESLREDYKFTGKEEDIEVGLVYFGARYYAPALNRWVSVDPLAVHAPGEADLNVYAYVHGQVLRAVDPLGLYEWDPNAPAPDGTKGVGTAAETVISVEPSGATPDNTSGAVRPAESALGNAAQAVAKAQGGDALGAVESGVKALNGVLPDPLGAALGVARNASKAIEAPAKMIDAYRDGGVNAVADQVLQRIPVIAPALQAYDAAQAARSAGDQASAWGAAGDAVAHGAQAIEQAAGLKAAAGAVRGGGCSGGSCGGPGVCFVAGTLVATAHGPVPIEQLRLGDRVEAGNTLCADDHVASDAKAITLEMPNPGQPLDVIRIRVLRPRSWIAEQGLDHGPAWLDLREVGVAGWASVTEVTGAPEEVSGSGCLVLMTIEHVASRVLLLRLVGGETLELTPPHKLFVEGAGWTRARELAPGMLLRSDKGVQTVEAVQLAPSNQHVYNLEVAREHTFRVGSAWLWTHNADCGEGAKGPEHHLMTNKNRTSTARGGPWTPRFEEMAKRAGMTLDDVANRVRIPGHRGPHPEAYHQGVFDRLTDATEGLSGEAYSRAFRAELRAIGIDAATPGSVLNRLLVP